MIKIQVTDKPTTGARDRVCLACGDNYFGWNMYVCQSCERARNYKIVEAWYV